MFGNLTDYNRFINEVESNATGNAKQGFEMINNPSFVRNNLSENWYGTTDASLVTKDISTYLFNSELDSFLQTFKSKTVNVDVIDLDQNKAIKFTEKEIGIFSFDLASLGLIRVYEYYSPLLDKVVSGNLVKSYKNEKGDLIFYHIYQPYIPKHIVEFNPSYNGYYSNVLKRVVPKDQLIEIITDEDIYFEFPERNEIPQHDVIRKQKIDDKGRKKFATTFKKSFVYIPKVEKPLQRLDLIIASNFNSGVDAKREMIYSSMAAITIAEKLSKSGVQYRIIVSYPVMSTRGDAKESYAFVTLKKEGEPLDKNKISILLSDGRYYRYQQFRGFYATQYDAGYDANINVSGIGRAIMDVDKIKNAYMDTLKTSINPDDILASKNEATKIVFSGALNESQAQKQYNEIIQKISKT
jgi:hypothetical protein